MVLLQEAMAAGYFGVQLLPIIIIGIVFFALRTTGSKRKSQAETKDQGEKNKWPAVAIIFIVAMLITFIWFANWLSNIKFE